MKTNDFTNEAVALCEAILQTSSPTKDWGIINLVKSGKSTREERLFNSLSFPNIPQGYYFAFDEIPTYLKETEVFCGIEFDGSWFLKIALSESDQSYDEEWQFQLESTYRGLTLIATKKGWVNKGASEADIKKFLFGGTPSLPIDVFVNTFKQTTGSELDGQNYVKWVSDGPKDRYHVVALFDRKKMEQFVLRNKGNLPYFDTKSNSLVFLGEVIDFSGVQAKMAKIMVENVNSIISWKELFELQGESYDKEVKRLNGTVGTIHGPLIDCFKHIKSKIYANKILDKRLSLLQHNGVGIFVDQRS